MNKRRLQMSFSINDIIALLRKRLILIIICTLSGLCVFFVFTRVAIDSTYSASVQLYVNFNETTSSIDLNDLYYAQKVVATYINFLETKVFYAQVIEESGLDYSVNELKNMIEIKAVNNTEIFQISVTSNSAETSYKLVTVMQELAPEHIKSIKSSADIRVVDPVTYPTGPSGPNTLYNTALGGLLGFLLSVSTIFLWEIVDVKVKNQDEIKNKYNKAILGSIPNYNNHRAKRTLHQVLITIIHRGKAKKEKAIKDDRGFLITEAFKELRTNLRYSLSKDGCKKILINSPNSQDGKSTICTNLGITLAQTGARVLLLDCDLRKGRLHSIFNLKSIPGTSELLIGLTKEKDVIQSTGYDTLHVIAMGKIPPNPAELLAGGQMEALLNALEKNYDYIIIDSPPVNVVSDALSLTKLVDGVVLVVREKATTHPDIAGAVSRLEFVDAKIIGFVFNGMSIQPGNKSKSKYYHNYYGAEQ
jgi:polysaccharide biosynthesis transport protein